MGRNWTRTRIVNALREAGISLIRLSQENGLGKFTLYSALDRPYPSGQKIIAKALGRSCHDIWPDFYDEADARITEVIRNRSAFKAARAAKGAA